MTAAQRIPTGQWGQVDQIVDALRDAHTDPSTGPVIASVTYTVDRDWSGDDAVHFTIVLADPVGRELYDLAEIEPIREELYDAMQRAGIDRIPYANFRLVSEQRALDADRDGAENDDE